MRTTTERTRGEDHADDDTDAEPDGDHRPDHLDDIADGCGCAEIWEHLSEHRGQGSGSDD